MAQALLARVRDSRGFTLIEVLVVVLVIGILAAIAIPAFLGQSLKAKDVSAKSNVKRLSQYVEECRVEATGNDYTDCNSAAELDGVPGLQWGAVPGHVGMIGDNPSAYLAYAVSESKTGSANHVFYIFKNSDGIAYRICSPEKAGACPAGALW